MRARTKVIVTIEQGQYTPIPGTSSQVLAGPGALEVVRYDDGAVSGRIISGESLPPARAVKRRLTRVGWGL